MTVATFTTRRTVVVAAAVRDTANALALDLDPVGGAETFTVPLSTDGALPASHYWCSTACDVMAAAKIDAMGKALVALGLDVRVFDGETDPDDALFACGLQRIADRIGGA